MGTSILQHGSSCSVWMSTWLEQQVREQKQSAYLADSSTHSRLQGLARQLSSGGGLNGIKDFVRAIWFLQTFLCFCAQKVQEDNLHSPVYVQQAEKNTTGNLCLAGFLCRGNTAI